MNPRRLYRSRRDRQLAGVAGGMAEYLEIDPTVVRILWILSVFLGGFTILLYIIMAFVVPLEPWPASPAGPWQAPGAPGTMPPTGEAGAESATESGTATGQAGATSTGAAPAGPAWGANPAWAAAAPGGPDDRRPGRGGLIIGVMLIVFGAIAMANVLLPGWAIGLALGPAFLVALGIALLVGSARRTTSETCSARCSSSWACSWS